MKILSVAVEAAHKSVDGAVTWLDVVAKTDVGAFVVLCQDDTLLVAEVRRHGEGVPAQMSYPETRDLVEAVLDCVCEYKG